MSVFLTWNVGLNRKSKSRYWPRHFFGLYGNNAHCLPTKAAERKQREALRGQTQQQSIPETHSELQPCLGTSKVKPNNGRWHPGKAEKPFLPPLWPQISSPLLHSLCDTGNTLDVLHFNKLILTNWFATEFRNSSRKQQKKKICFSIVVNRFSQVSWFPSRGNASKAEFCSSSKDLRRLSVNLGHLGRWVIHANQYLHWLIVEGQGIWGVWEVTFHTGSQLFSSAFSSVHYSALQGKATAFIWHRW